MRLIVDSVVAIMLAAVLGGVLMYTRASAETEDAIDATRNAVRQIEQTIRIRAATGQTVVNGRGWPMTVDPEWFGANPPDSAIVSGDRPWLEVAPREHAALDHPPVRVTVDRNIAAFWYNPGNGAVRARAPMAVSDRRAMEIYEKVNGDPIDSIVSRDVPSPNLVDDADLDQQHADSEADEKEQTNPIPDVDYDYEEYGNLDPTVPRDAEPSPEQRGASAEEGAQR